jgi:hypothetical protein
MNDITATQQFLIHVDIDQLEAFCSVSKAHYNVCNTKQFWIDKFKLDNLPLFHPYPKIFDEWVELYVDTDEAIDEAALNLDKKLDDIVYDTCNEIDKCKYNTPRHMDRMKKFIIQRFVEQYK